MLYGWMKSIVIYLILSGIVVNMSPSASYKKYIQFFTGLLLLIIIAEPIKFVFNISSLDLDRLLCDVDYSLIYAENNQTENMENYYELTIEESIKRDLAEKEFYADRIVIISSEKYEIKKCVINYYPSEKNNEDITAEALDEIKKAISDVYNIEIDNIYIVSR